VIEGTVRRRSTLRLTAEDMAAGYALACQTVVEGDVRIVVPPQEKIERRPPPATIPTTSRPSAAWP